MLTSTGLVYVSLRLCTVRLQLVHVSVRLDYRPRVGMVHVSGRPETAKNTANTVSPGSHRFQWSMLKRT